MEEEIEPLNMVIVTKSTWKQTFPSTVMEIYIFFHYLSLYADKNGHFAGIMLNASTIAL